MIKLVGESLKQYDLNRQVEIIPTGTVLEVKFLNRSPNPFEVPFTEENGRVYADVPSILLKTFGVITVETLEMLEDGSQIEQRQTFNVDRAKRPEGYECPAPEILTPNHLKNNGGGASSWNDLKDKPFEETTVMGDTLTWDGDMTGKVYVELEYPVDDEGNTTPAYFVKVSDVVPTIEELQGGGTATISAELESMVYEFGEDKEMYYTDTGKVIADKTQTLPIIVKENNVDLTEMLGMPLIVPEKGVYFATIPLANMVITSFTINNYTDFETIEVKPLDPKYVPFDDIHRTYFYEENNSATNSYDLYVDKERTTLATYQDIENAYYKGQIVIVDAGYNQSHYIPVSVQLVPPFSAEIIAIYGIEASEPVFRTYRVGSLN